MASRTLRNLLLLAACGALAPLVVACAGGPRPAAPPPRRLESRPPQPHARAVWVPGHWKYRPRVRSYVWVAGRWR